MRDRAKISVGVLSVCLFCYRLMPIRLIFILFIFAAMLLMPVLDTLSGEKCILCTTDKSTDHHLHHSVPESVLHLCSNHSPMPCIAFQETAEGFEPFSFLCMKCSSSLLSKMKQVERHLIVC